MMLFSVVGIVLASVAGADACPHWISVMPLKSDDAVGIAADAVAQGNETLVDGISWICAIHPGGNPAADKAAACAKSYRAIEPLVRARSKVKQGVLLQSTMGHGGFPGEATPWQLTVKPDGTSVYRMCPLDARFLDYVARSCRTLAELKPDFFMVDDDTRMVWGDTPGCFCPLHLSAFAKATGRGWTREQAVAAVRSGSAETRAIWEKVKFDSLAGLFRTIRANFVPETPGILCVVESSAHFRHARAFATMLAAPGQVPVVRGNGPNYCGNDLYHRIYSRASFAHQLAALGKGVVFMQEADTCPQTVWSCSGMREYDNMVMQMLEGVKGAKIWITRTQMTRERKSQAVYRRILRENRGLMEWAAKTDFRQSGVVVPASGWINGFAERYLGLMGIPFRYGTAESGEVTALCAENLNHLTDAEISKVLSGNVLLDGSAAIWLASRGYAADIGVSARPWARKTVQSHLDGDGVEIGGGMRVNRSFADLSAVQSGARTLSRLYNIASVGAMPSYEAPGSVSYANARGGRVVTFALPLPSNHPAYYESTMFSEGYKAWIIGLINGFGRPLEACFAGVGAVTCEVGTTPTDGKVFVINMIDPDDLPELEMCFAVSPARIERLGGDGVWRNVAFTRTTSGTFVLASPVRPLSPAIFRYVEMAGLERND